MTNDFIKNYYDYIVVGLLIPCSACLLLIAINLFIDIIDKLFFSSGEDPGRMSGASGEGSGAHESGGGCDPEEEDPPKWVL